MLRRFFALLLSISILLLIGCGKNTPPKPSAYQIGLDPSWYPINLTGKDNNILGFSTELMKTICAEENTTFSMIYTAWDSLLDGLAAGKYQGALSSLYPYNFNLQKFDFSDVYLPLGPVLLAAAGSPYHSLDDLQGKPVAVLSGSPSVLLLESKPQIFITPCNSVAEVINLLQSGQVTGALLPVVVAESYTGGSLQNKFVIVSPPLTDEGLRLLTMKNKNGALIKKFNKGLAKMKKTGTYNALLSEWKLTSPPGNS